MAGGGDGGNGGPFSFGREGIGPGHGLAGSSSPSVSGVAGGSGAGFGTMGGQGGAGVTFRAGGAPYGAPLRDLLYAGSGGGGGQSVTRFGGGGGAGGGALEIGALASLEFTSATMLANGGNGSDGFAAGGGGSGGGILLHAFEVSMDSDTLIQASGGHGIFSGFRNQGGCGGAGRIEILHHPSGNFSDFGMMEANAGAFDGDCNDGVPVITETTEVGVPEPASWLLMLIGMQCCRRLW